MGLLNHLFGSTESYAKEMEVDEEFIVKHWKHYLSTVSRKKDLIRYMRTRLEANFQNNLQELKKLLDLELVDISGEEKSGIEIIGDLELIEHPQKVKRVHKLEQCLVYAETKHEYVYGLLHQLHSFLKSQMHIVNKMLSGSVNTETLISHLKLQIELEIEIIKKIEQIETFHSLFLALIKGEHIIKTMDAGEGRLLKKMQKGVGKIFSNEITGGITYDWAMGVFNAIEDKVHELVANNLLDQHPDMDFEFVNRPIFIELVKKVIQNLRPRNVSEQMINVFIHLFREWYNHERD